MNQVAWVMGLAGLKWTCFLIRWLVCSDACGLLGFLFAATWSKFYERFHNFYLRREIGEKCVPNAGRWRLGRCGKIFLLPSLLGFREPDRFGADSASNWKLFFLFRPPIAPISKSPTAQTRITCYKSDPARRKNATTTTTISTKGKAEANCNVSCGWFLLHISKPIKSFAKWLDAYVTGLEAFDNATTFSMLEIHSTRFPLIERLKIEIFMEIVDVSLVSGCEALRATRLESHSSSFSTSLRLS